MAEGGRGCGDWVWDGEGAAVLAAMLLPTGGGGWRLWLGRVLVAALVPTVRLGGPGVGRGTQAAEQQAAEQHWRYSGG